MYTKRKKGRNKSNKGRYTPAPTLERGKVRDKLKAVKYNIKVYRTLLLPDKIKALIRG